jgi:hypothetical protein
MNIELEDRLRADMERFTRDLRLPSGLALTAYRHNRKRRRTLRVTAASGTAIAVAASAVAIAGASGAFGSAHAPATRTETTAYVLEHVESALAATSVDNLISVDRIVFPPDATQEPIVGGLSGGSGTGSTGSPWRVAYMVNWAYRDTGKYSAYSPTGQHVFDVEFSVANGAVTETAVVDRDSTWWTATITAGGPIASSGCATHSVVLTHGPGNGWPAFIRSQLSCGAYTVAGHQVVDGIDAIKITATGSPLTLLVNPATYLPVELSIGPLQMHFQWLSPTPANLAQLQEPVPAGFRQVPPPMQP